MTDGSTVLLITAYCYASLIVAVLLPIYLCVSPKRASLSLTMGLHKLLVVLTVLLPLALCLRALPYEPSSSALAERDEGPGFAAVGIRPMTGTRDIGAPNAAALGNPDRSQTAAAWESADQLRSVNDIAYFFGETLIWFAISGLLVFMLRYAWQMLQVSRILREAERVEVRDGIEILRSRRVVAPFSIGCIVPRVLLPSGLDDAAREPVIRHEANHFECRHHWWALGEAMLAHVFWFNPVMHVLRRRGAFLRELESDLRTVRDMDRFAYAQALIASAEQILVRRCPVIGGHAWIERNRLKARIEFVLGKPKSIRRFASWSILLTVLSGAAGGGIVVGNINDRFLQDEILATIHREYARTAGERPLVDLSLVPAEFRRGLLLYYDDAFYRHDGVRLFRGSTLTQQLARTFLQTRGFKVDRKVRELKVARVLEDNFSKDEILGMYLDRVFWGNRAYGLSQAATTYFAKPYSELTRDESAMLIPFLDAPSAYNMLANAELATRRQQQLLARMDALVTE